MAGSSLRITCVDIETEPVFLAATADWVLGTLGDGGGDKGNQRAVRIHRARNATLCWPARWPEPRVERGLAPLLGPQRPVPVLQDPNENVQGLAG